MSSYNMSRKVVFNENICVFERAFVKGLFRISNWMKQKRLYSVEFQRSVIYYNSVPQFKNIQFVLQIHTRHTVLE